MKVELVSTTKGGIHLACKLLKIPNSYNGSWGDIEVKRWKSNNVEHLLVEAPPSKFLSWMAALHVWNDPISLALDGAWLICNTKVALALLATYNVSPYHGKILFDMAIDGEFDC